MSAAVAFSTVCMTQYSAYAEEAPTDVHLTVETKEIDIEDIPADRVVTLNIYLENCPPYNTLVFGVLKDSRLEFYNDTDCFEMADGVTYASYPDCSKFPSIPDYMSCATGAAGGRSNRVEYENAIVKVSFVLPEQVSAGDFFAVELPRRFETDVVYLTMSPLSSDYFEDFPFTQLNSGGIRITQRDQPPPANDNNGGNISGGETQSSGEGNAPQSGGGNETVPSQDSGSNNNSQAAAEAVISDTVTETTALQTTELTTSESRTTTTTSSETTMTTTSESASTTETKITTISVTTGAEEEPEKRNTGGLKTIGIITLIIAAVCSVFTLAARLRMK